ncbi:MAG: hypothetical protein IT176_06495 [Acidobacteria bacterium]|nr:hypothetical protein [Acidobacteriota bacterium]
MTRPTWLLVGCLCLAFGLGPGSRVSAQPAQRHDMSQMMGQATTPMYDSKSETTIKGTVEKVEETAPGGAMGRGRGRGMGQGMGGTHMIVKTDSGSVVVHLGPTAFLAEHDLKIADGDRVEVLGSRVAMGGEDVVIAREITSGGKTLTLRDASGRPLWRMQPGPK